MKKVSLLLAVILTIALLLSACGGGAAPNMNYDAGMSNEGFDIAADSDSLKESPTYGDVGSDIYTDESNKIIRTANLTIQSTEFDAAVDALNKLTEQHGGYYESAEVSGGGYYDKYASRTAYFRVRVPKENYAAFKSGTGGIGHVYSISESTDDVGETYYDTEARLQTLTVKRDRLLALLEEAEKMEDILYLEDALAEVQYQIDAHTATLRKYDSLIDYSTFVIRLNEVVVIKDDPGVKESFGAQLLASFKSGLTGFVNGLGDFTLWFARNLMGIIIFAAIVVAAVFVGRGIVRKRRARTQKKDQ